MQGIVNFFCDLSICVRKQQILPATMMAKGAKLLQVHRLLDEIRGRHGHPVGSLKQAITLR